MLGLGGGLGVDAGDEEDQAPHRLAFGRFRRPEAVERPAVGTAELAEVGNGNDRLRTAVAKEGRAGVSTYRFGTRAALANPEVRKKLQDLHIAARSGSPEQTRQLLESEIKRWGEVIRAAGIKPE